MSKAEGEHNTTKHLTLPGILAGIFYPACHYDRGRILSSGSNLKCSSRHPACHEPRIGVGRFFRQSLRHVGRPSLVAFFFQFSIFPPPLSSSILRLRAYFAKHWRAFRHVYDLSLMTSCFSINTPYNDMQYLVVKIVLLHPSLAQRSSMRHMEGDRGVYKIPSLVLYQLHIWFYPVQ
jgi:hypothetical protein